MSAAVERAKEIWPPRIFYGLEYSTDLNGPLREAFVAGAEWQAEQTARAEAAEAKISEVTDSMVEAGALAMLACWEIDGDPPSLHEQARAVLEAVYGKAEQ